MRHLATGGAFFCLQLTVLTTSWWCLSCNKPMGTFDNFIKTAISNSLGVIGEPASIGGNQFTASFEDSRMDITRHVFGDEDDVSTVATCLKSALTNEPRINETLIRVNERKTYVITEVQSDVESYAITLRSKDG